MRLSPSLLVVASFVALAPRSLTMKRSLLSLSIASLVALIVYLVSVPSATFYLTSPIAVSLVLVFVGSTSYLLLEIAFSDSPDVAEDVDEDVYVEGSISEEEFAEGLREAYESYYDALRTS